MEYRKIVLLILTAFLSFNSIAQTKPVSSKNVEQAKANSEKNKEMLKLALEKNPESKTPVSEKNQPIVKPVAEKAGIQVKRDTLKTLLANIIPVELDSLANLKFKPYKKSVHASYYHDKFNGQRTASGKKFSNNNLTAAHRKFPFGTRLKITNEKNGKSVIVEVTDRGPFSRGREVDLTKRAFMEIADNKNSGVMIVNIEEEK